MMKGNVNVQTGLRVDKFVFDGFKELCRCERLMVGEAELRETRVDRAIYRPAYETALATLPKVKDEELIREAQRILEKANEAAEKAIG